MSLALSVEQVEAIAELRRARPELRVVLVGATAVSHYVSIDRYTGDVDLVLVAELVELAPVLEPLGSWRAFSASGCATSRRTVRSL